MESLNSKIKNRDLIGNIGRHKNVQKPVLVLHLLLIKRRLKK